jgi:hypothetical protein
MDGLFPEWDSGGCKLGSAKVSRFFGLHAGDAEGALFRVSFDGNGIALAPGLAPGEAVDRFWSAFGATCPFERDFRSLGWVVLGSEETRHDH